MRILTSFLLAVVSAASTGVALAQQKPATKELTGSAALSGGKVANLTVLSAEAASTVTVAGKEIIKPKERIENLQIQSADVASGRASGGTFELPSPLVMDAERGTVKTSALRGTSLMGATLNAVKPAGGTLKFKVAGKDVSADISGQVLQLTNVQVSGKTDVAEAVVTAAALQPPPAKAAVTTTDKVNLLNDILVFNVEVEHFGQSIGGPPDITAPQGSCFRVSEEFEQDDPAEPGKKQKYIRGMFHSGYFPRWLLPPYICPSEEEMRAAGVNTRRSHYVLRDVAMETRDRSRFGWTYGVLVAPFKYYLDSHNLNAGATVGPYLGYRWHDRQGGSSILGFAVGATSATVKTNNPDGTSTDTEKTGLSAAVSLLFEIKNDFNMGVMLGADYFSKVDDIPNSGKAWFGISLGRKLD